MSQVHILFDICFNIILPSAADTSLNDVRIKHGAELSSFSLSSVSHSFGLYIQMTASPLLSRIFLRNYMSYGEDGTVYMVLVGK
jgi:hypothetical protein